MADTKPAALALPTEMLTGMLMEALKAMLSDPDTQKKLLGALVGLLGGLFTSKPAPIKPVTKPEPSPGPQDPEFPDDIIPAPVGEVKVKRVRLKLARAQYSHQRNPEMYGEPTQENPDRNKQGLVSNARLRQIEAGEAFLNYASKAWYDITAYDEKDHEILRDRVLSSGLAYKTRFEFNDNGFYQGNGAEEGTGLPMEPTHEDPAGMTYGWEAWRSSLGFLLQTKHHEEGTYTVRAEVAGVKSNAITIKVS